eukprot:1484223-Prymnesium_polylepis.1
MIDAPGQLSTRREESMVLGATGAKEGARVGHAHPLLTGTAQFSCSAGRSGPRCCCGDGLSASLDA